MTDERTQGLATIDEEVRSCTRCSLSATRVRAVPGEGPVTAEVMFIGEGPGYHEDRQGRPFVGPSGHLLDELLASIGLARSAVYITNVVKCRPPQNRDPAPAEIDTCVPLYLERQIALIEPAADRHARPIFHGAFPSRPVHHAYSRPAATSARQNDSAAVPSCSRAAPSRPAGDRQARHPADPHRARPPAGNSPRSGSLRGHARRG